MAEKGINIKIDAELYRRIKIKVATNGTTIKDYVVSLILNDLGNEIGYNSDQE